MRYLCLLLLLSSCSTALYSPNTKNAPLFREQGEAQISGYVGSAGIEAQGAYSISDHFALIGSYAYLSSKESVPITYDRKNGYGEIGVGIFDYTRAFRYEVFAGYGFGQATSAAQYYFYGVNNTVAATGKLSSLIFIQPTIGTNNENFNISFTPRIARVNYSEFTAAGVTKTPTQDGPVTFVEPTLTAKFRLAGNLHGIFQLGLTMPTAADVYFKYNTTNTSLGIQIDTGGMRTRVYKK